MSEIQMHVFCVYPVVECSQKHPGFASIMHNTFKPHINNFRIQRSFCDGFGKCLARITLHALIFVKKSCFIEFTTRDKRCDFPFQIMFPSCKRRNAMMFRLQGAKGPLRSFRMRYNWTFVFTSAAQRAFILERTEAALRDFKCIVACTKRGFEFPA